MTVYKRNATSLGLLFLAAIAAYETGNGLIASTLNSPQLLERTLEQPVRLALGASLMLLNSLIVVSIGLVLLTVLRHYSESLAVGYLTSRIVEAVLLSGGVISLLLLFPLSQQGTGGVTDAAYLQTTATLALKGNYYAYQLAMMALGVGSLTFCYVLYQTRLIPRAISVLGFAGYSALAAGSLAEVFGFNIGLLLSLPGGLFEFVLPLWLFTKGFKLASKESVSLI